MLSADKLVEAAHDLRFTLEQILQEDLRCFGFVSFASCFETIVHLQRDIDRLYALHQKLVDPAKHVAYSPTLRCSTSTSAEGAVTFGL